MRVVLGGICVMLCMTRGGGPSCLAGSSRGSVHVSVSFDARIAHSQVSKSISHFMIFVFAYTCVIIGIYFLSFAAHDMQRGVKIEPVDGRLRTRAMRGGGTGRLNVHG